MGKKIEWTSVRVGRGRGLGAFYCGWGLNQVTKPGNGSQLSTTGSKGSRVLNLATKPGNGTLNYKRWHRVGGGREGHFQIGCGACH